MLTQANATLVLGMLRLIETRELSKLPQCYHPEVSFHWPPGLPYSGSFVGAEVARMSERFAATWLPLQPTAETRTMNGRVLAAGDDGRVIVHYLWKGLDESGRYFETETLADYLVRDSLLARAQMFYYDLPGMISFLASARTVRPG